MKKIIWVVLISAGFVSLGDVLTFDDHPDAVQNGYADVGNYAGFDFSLNLDWIDTVGSSYNYGAISGEFTVLNNNSGMGVVTEESGGDFVFNGVYFRSWNDSRSGTIRGMKDGAEVWSATVNLNATVWGGIGGQVGAIDELQLDMGDYFLIDNLDIEAVPEPATAGMLAGAGLLLAAYRRWFCRV